MKRLIPFLIVFAFVSGCSQPKQVPTEPPSPAVAAVTGTQAQAGGANVSGAPAFHVPYPLRWNASTSPNIAYYELQQTTNILSKVFFDVTNIIGTNYVAILTNQSGTFRVRAVTRQGIVSAWTYQNL